MPRQESTPSERDLILWESWRKKKKKFEFEPPETACQSPGVKRLTRQGTKMNGEHAINREKNIENSVGDKGKTDRSQVEKNTRRRLESFLSPNKREEPREQRQGKGLERV